MITIQEEEEWHELMAKVDQLDIEQEQIAANEEDPSTSAAAEKHAGQEIAALRALNKDLHCKVTMQVDAVCKLVGNIEDLIDRANQTAQDVHVRQHQKRFENFAHIDSPQVLLKKVMQGAPAPPSS